MSTGGDYYSNAILFVWREFPGLAVIQQFKGLQHGFGFGSNPGSITIPTITEKQSG